MNHIDRTIHGCSSLPAIVLVINAGVEVLRFDMKVVGLIIRFTPGGHG